jgi:hypothetical protein
MLPKYVARSSAVAARELGGEMIIMSATDSTLFTLNETATIIWRAADGRTSLTDIVKGHLCQEFEISSEQAYRDAVEFVEELARHGILRLSDQPILDPQAVNSQP